jgi:hypothetical protein
MAKLVNAKQHRGHNEGSYRQRTDGRWECLFTLPDGKRKSVYGKSRPEVRIKMEEALGKAKKGIDLKGERQTLAQFLDVWMTETQLPKLRPSTIKSYESYIRLHVNPKLGYIPLGELTAQDVQRFLNACSRDGRVKRSKSKQRKEDTHKEGSAPDEVAPGLSPRSVQYIRAILCAALAQAENWGYVERNVAKLASPPRQKPKAVARLPLSKHRSSCTRLAKIA